MPRPFNQHQLCLIPMYCVLFLPSQIVWVASESLGVGRAIDGEVCVVVAFYEPPGNMEGSFGDNVLRMGSSVRQRKSKEPKGFVPPTPGETYKLFVKILILYTSTSYCTFFSIGHFRDAASLCFKRDQVQNLSCVNEFLLSCKKKLIFTRRFFTWLRFKRGFLELANGLFLVVRNRCHIKTMHCVSKSFESALMKVYFSKTFSEDLSAD